MVTYWIKTPITRNFIFCISYVQTTHASLPSHSVWANWCSYYMATIQLRKTAQNGITSSQAQLLCKCSTSPSDNGLNLIRCVSMQCVVRCTLVVFFFFFFVLPDTYIGRKIDQKHLQQLTSACLMINVILRKIAKRQQFAKLKQW